MGVVDWVPTLATVMADPKANDATLKAHTALPALSQDTRTRDPDFVDNALTEKINANPSWSHSELFSASWEIDIFGRLRNQKMQQQMQEAQEQLDAAEYEATSGGGMVSVKVSGKRELTSITIDPQVVDPDDIEMLQDLIMAAVNEALRKGEEARETTMGRMAPGMGGLF